MRMTHRRKKGRDFRGSHRHRLSLETLENRWLLTMIAVPSSTPGEITALDQTDVYTFEAEVGTVYEITATRGCEGCQPNTTLPLLLLSNDAGRAEALRSPRDESPSIHWAAPADGIYTIEAQNNNDPDIGTYTLEINGTTYADDHANSTALSTELPIGTPIVGEIEVNGDVDVFSFSAAAGDDFQFTATRTNDQSPVPRLEIIDQDGLTRIEDSRPTEDIAHIDWVAPAEGNYFVVVSDRLDNNVLSYSLLAEQLTDDHGSVLAAATVISAPSTVQGEINFPGDIDNFQFTAERGTIYEVEATNTSGGSLAFELSVYDAESRLTRQLEDESGSIHVTWLAETNGPHFLQIAEQSGLHPLDGYQIRVQAVTYDDDHGQHADEATSVSVPSETPGRIEVAADADVFSFEATAGTTYNFSLDSSASLTVYDTDGTTQLVHDPQGRGSIPPLITWTAPNDGIFFLKVDSIFPTDYLLTIDIPIDDQQGGTGAAIPVASNSTTTGSIDFIGDIDVFSFTAIAGRHYRIGLGDRTARLRLLDTDGETPLFSTRTGDEQLWQAPTDGVFFVEVGSFSRPLNLDEYTLHITQSLPCDFTGDVDGCNVEDLNLLLLEQPTVGEINQWLSEASSIENQSKQDPNHVYVFGDTDLDGDVDSQDLGTLLTRFGRGSGLRSAWQNGDLNGDRAIDSTDLGLLLLNFGHSSPLASATIASTVYPIDQGSAATPDSPTRRSEKLNAQSKDRSHFVADFVFSRFGEGYDED